MKLPRKFLQFDYGVHISYVILMLFCFVLSPFTLGFSVMFSLLVWPVIIIWQVLSALILVLGYKDKLRMYYLIAVMAYGILYFTFFVGNPVYGSPVYLSLFFVAWYAYLTYKDATYRSPSFWDLEF